MVMGNHEYYRRFVPVELALAKERAPSFNIICWRTTASLSAMGTVDGGVRFLGATLWTDYAHLRRGQCRGSDERLRHRHERSSSHRLAEKAMAALPAAGGLPFCIISRRRFSPRHWRRPSTARLLWSPIMLPHLGSVPPRFQSDPLTGAYVSDLSALVETCQPTLLGTRPHPQLFGLPRWTNPRAGEPARLWV